MRSKALIVAIVLVGGLASVALASSGPDTGWRAVASTFVPEPTTATSKYALTDSGGVTFRPGAKGALWFRANIDSTPEDGDFWNSMTVEFSDGAGASSAVWVGLYSVEIMRSGGTGEPTLMGHMYSEDLVPYFGRPIVCLTGMIQETSYHLWNGGGTEYAYFIRAGIYRSSPEAAPPTLHMVSVTRWADIDATFGVLECPGWHIW